MQQSLLEFDELPSTPGRRIELILRQAPVHTVGSNLGELSAKSVCSPGSGTTERCSGRARHSSLFLQARSVRFEVDHPTAAGANPNLKA